LFWKRLFKSWTAAFIAIFSFRKNNCLITLKKSNLQESEKYDAR